MSVEKGSTRVKILHYHLFKNAGTSVDAILKANFKAEWQEREFPGIRPPEVPAAVQNWLTEELGVTAYSSHTALGPLPKQDGVTLFSLLFVRHPIDRIQSAYHFERKQNADTFGSKVAAKGSFADYVTTLLDTPNERSLRNFQTLRLSQFAPDDGVTEYDRAISALSRVSFVGLVDQFGASMHAFAQLLRPYFPDFHVEEVRENTQSKAGETLDQRLAAVRDTLGVDVFNRLVLANADDIRLYAEIGQRFAQRRPVVAVNE